MWVLATAHNNGVDRNKNGKDAGQAGLNGNEDDTGDGLCGLGNAKLLDENQDTDDGKDPDGLDDQVDDVARLGCIGSGPQE